MVHTSKANEGTQIKVPHDTWTSATASNVTAHHTADTMRTPPTPKYQAQAEEMGAHESQGIVTPLKLVVSTVLVNCLQQLISPPDNDIIV